MTPDEKRAYQREWTKQARAKNPEKYRQIQANYRARHLEEVREYQRKYNHTEKGKARLKRYVERHPEKRQALNKIHNRRNLRFKDRFVHLKENPRKGKCSKCGKEGLTNMHHTKYDESNPLAYTVELCVKCHNKQHPKNRNELGQFAT